MSIRNAIACVAVKDLKSSLAWYEKLLGRGPDRGADTELAEWVFEQGGRLQLQQQPSRAGSGSVTLAVGSLDTEMLQLNRWGISSGDVIRTSAQRILVIEDPDGNTVSLAEMLLPAPREGVSTVGSLDAAKGPHPLELALESIAAEPRLSARTVTDFLNNLIVDLEALLRASEENMTGPRAGRRRAAVATCAHRAR